MKSAQEVFQKRMWQCFGDLPAGVEIDILPQVWAVRRGTQQFTVSSTKDKCRFNLPEVTYLGHTVSADGLAPDRVNFE